MQLLQWKYTERTEILRSRRGRQRKRIYELKRGIRITEMAHGSGRKRAGDRSINKYTLCYCTPTLIHQVPWCGGVLGSPKIIPYFIVIENDSATV